MEMRIMFKKNKPPKVTTIHWSITLLDRFRLLLTKPYMYEFDRVWEWIIRRTTFKRIWKKEFICRVKRYWWDIVGL